MGEGLGGHQEEPTTIAQVCAAYADIWQRALEDYSKEYMIMTRLVAARD